MGGYRLPEILQAFHASQRRRYPQFDWVYGRLSLVLFGASVTNEKTAQMSAMAMMVETLVMTNQKALTMLLAKMEMTVRLAVLDVRAFGHPSRSSRLCRPLHWPDLFCHVRLRPHAVVHFPLHPLSRC